jgi:hypothetical protein
MQVDPAALVDGESSSMDDATIVVWAVSAPGVWEAGKGGKNARCARGLAPYGPRWHDTAVPSRRLIPPRTH